MLAERQIRDAASQTNGAVLSGQRGLILTICATQEEFDDAQAQTASAVSRLALSIVQRKSVFESRVQQEQVG